MTQTNPVLVAIRERRSVRAFTDEPVSREELLEILEAGRWAPSGLNNQPWRFLALMAGDPRQAALAGCTRYAPIVRAAKALVCVMLKKDELYNPMKDHQGAGACIQNMLLAAHALGLGAVWLGEIVNDQAKSLAAAGLSAADFELMAVIALGRPAGRPKSTRKALADILLESL